MRQKVRRTLIFLSFLLFPVTIWYFSPALIIQAASRHIMNGSFFVFMTMLIASMFLDSDVELILNTFGKETKQSLRVTNISLYYAGQILIALSLMFLK